MGRQGYKHCSHVGIEVSSLVDPATITLEEEELAIKNMFRQFQGPPESISLPDAQVIFVGKAGALG